MPLSVVIGTTADAIAGLAPLYLRGRVLDVTYGRGGFWRRYRPAGLTTHDLERDGVDFRDLPHGDRTFDAVCFDPPFIPTEGPRSRSAGRAADFNDRYGLTKSRTPAELEQLVAAGLAESARVTRRWLIAKTSDYVNRRCLRLSHVALIGAGLELGLTVHDLIVVAAGAGPEPSGLLELRRSRRAHSYLIVFRRSIRGYRKSHELDP